MSEFDRTAWRAFLIGAGILALALQVLAIHRQSLIGDAPYHLLAGDQILRDGNNVLNLEHPPLVKMIAALPLAMEERLAPSVEVNRAIPVGLDLFDRPDVANRARIRSRLAVFAVFVIPLALACWLLGWELAGVRTGAVLALTVGLSFNALPYFSVLQTDAAACLGFVLTAWAAICYSRRPSVVRAVGVGLAVGLGLSAKFSGVLLLPVLPVAVYLARVPWRHRFAHAAVMAICASVLLLTTYALANTSYDSQLGRRAIQLYCSNQGTLGVDGRLLPWEETLLAVEARSPHLAQWLVGFLGIRAQNAIGVYPSYAFGEISYSGRWWYFPAVLLIKTPWAILIFSALAMVGWARGGDSLPRDALYVIGTIVAIYFGLSITSNYNLGMRHMLPIVPMLALPAVLWASQVRVRAVVLVALLAAESLLLSPLWLSATNTWWLGQNNPTMTVFSHSNMEAHQNFIALARHADKQDLEPLFVVQPGIRRSELRTYFPEATLLEATDKILPGWYAINVTVEQLIPAIIESSPGSLRNDEVWRRRVRDWQPAWERIRKGEDHGFVAGTYHLYRVSR